MATLVNRRIDYSNFRRIALSGDLPTSTAGHTIRDRMTGDTGELGIVLGMGYYYNATYNSMITSDTANTQFIHGAFDYSATSGTGRGAYLITKFSGAGGSGECMRIRSTVSAAMSSGGAIHGIHSEARLLSGGYVTNGLVAGLRATLAAEASSTITTGTLSALRLDSDLALTSTAANASFIALADVNGTNKMPFFMNLEGVASAATSAFRGTGTVSAFTLGGLRVKMPDGSVGYIPIGTTISA
jgi:hypothetical protein